jgi:Ser/Thr protein kinase RdoA (MazF antagonist)
MTQAFIPVIHSIPSGEALISMVLPNYPIGKPHSCKLLKRGLNDTYLVETEQEKYILRLYRRGWRTKEEIDFELELLAFLHEQNQPIAYPIERKDSSFTTGIAAPEGKRYAALFSYALGKAVNEKLEGEQSQRLGEVLAIIHQTLNNFNSSFSRPHLNNEYLLDRSITAILNLYKHRINEFNYLHAQIEQIKKQLESLKLSKSTPEYGICVGDVHSGNAHFNEENQPTLFDFDQCGHGWRAFDIAKFMHIAITWKIDVKVRNLFLEGYQRIRQLDTVELASIPIFIKAAHIWVMGLGTGAVGDVLPYGWFTDDWLDQRLATLKSLDVGNNGK